MSTVTVRFSAQRAIISQWIRWWTFSPFSHVEFLLGSGKTLGARLIGGVKEREIGDYSSYSDVTIEGGNVLEEAKKMIGTKYDLLSLLSFPFRIEAQESKKVTCIEFVSELLHRHGIINVPNTHRLTPYQLYLILINIGWSRRVTA
jgi:hypothetical protein